ncbi:fatty acid--CoA ligase [Arundinibacter roseus]|uniref:Fatty acid--CoA ligase n=1 Tax=Arundinibacter roseus TaxID=2070510 RepID=A0A4R4KDU1_9BACT|nr:fatty acid--CoA ligase [Arundinibacter roseus]TDB64569.1 fatty acid--CoA ligase [Arundinibacter roseus]
MTKTKRIPRTPSAYDQPLLIKTLLLQSERYNPEREIVYRDLFRMDYFELNRRIRRLANALRTLGIAPGSTVAVMDWDSHRYLECFFAVPCMGAILHTINVRLSPAQILYTINHAEDDILLIHEDFLPILESIHGQITSTSKIVIMSDKVYTQQKTELTKPSFPTLGEYEALLAAQPAEYDFPDFEEDSWATTFYTTGTTGNPKGVYFSHRQLFMHTMGLLAYFCGYEALPFSHRDVYMPITPMFHVHAWGFPFLATMLNNKQVYPGRYEPEMLLRLLIQEKVTLSHCVPTILGMLVNSPIAKQVDLSNWKVIIGGSALTRGLAQAAISLGINVSQGYGMSETAPIMSVVHLNDQQLGWDVQRQLDLRTKAGRIAPFVDLRVLDEKGDILPHDGQSVGELVARGAWMTQGYYKDEVSSENLWKGGWLHTGDVGSIGPDFYLTISDRVKDVIKTGGEWVSSLDIENIFSQMDGVAEVAVVGLPDERWGERPYALVVPKPDFVKTLSSEILHQHILTLVETGEINRWYIPNRIVLVAEIPKTSVGKLDKKKIRTEMKELLVG